MQNIRFESARDFVDYLRPSSDRWWDEVLQAPTHVFRGQEDAAWSLLPAGWRPLDDKNKLTPLVEAFGRQAEKLGHSWPDGQEVQRKMTLWNLALEEAVYDYARVARSVGLEVPWNIPSSKLGMTSPDYNVTEPPIELTSLAQHHGVPTRFLDWSEDPLSAAFFSLGEPGMTTDLCVWALPREPVTFTEELRVAEMFPPLKFGLRWVATAGNPNIVAQRGVLLGYENIFVFAESFKAGWRSFEQTAAFNDGLIKLVLRGDQREMLRDLLFREGRSEAHLMPSWRTAAQSAVNRWGRAG